MWDSCGIMLRAKLLLSIYLSLACGKWEVERQLTDSAISAMRPACCVEESGHLVVNSLRRR